MLGLLVEYVWVLSILVLRSLLFEQPWKSESEDIMKYTISNIDDMLHVQNVEKGLRVTMNGTMFQESIISKIVIFKFIGADEPAIFVELYMGNINIATWIVKEVVFTEDRYSPQGEQKEGKLNGYTIRLPYDFEK